MARKNLKTVAKVHGMHLLQVRAVLRAWANLLFLECQRARLASEPGVDAASVAELLARLASPPYRSVMSVAVTTLGTDIVDVRLLRAMSVVVGVDELLWSELVSLLKIEATGVAKRLESGRISSP